MTAGASPLLPFLLPPLPSPLLSAVPAARPELPVLPLPPVLPVTAGVAVAVALLLAAPGGRRRARTGRPARSVPVLTGIGLVALVVTDGGLRLVPPALLAVAAGYGALRLWRLRSERLVAERNAARVQQACELVAAELVAGRPPGDALDRAAADWPALAPVAAAHALGDSVPAALRGVAVAPGAGSLRLVAAAWQVSHRTGHGLAATVVSVAEGLRRDAATRRVAAAELSSARATARLVAALPVLALVMGSGAGGNPWAFLLGTPVGLACLAAGLALAGLGLAWIERIAAGVVTDP